MTTSTAAARHTLKTATPWSPPADPVDLFTLPAPEAPQTPQTAQLVTRAAAAPAEAPTRPQKAIADAKPVPDTAADAEAQLRAIWEAWSADRDQRHAADHARRYAGEAVRLGLSFFDREGCDLGAKGWQLWADYAAKAKKA